ncbi:MAG: hypothetical protein LUG18_05630, partial [Candidatus Azobacteroides sp.]|nr:hypothetical protein [Candidatus Azobacteroides sp.]
SKTNLIIYIVSSSRGEWCAADLFVHAKDKIPGSSSLLRREVPFDFVKRGRVNPRQKKPEKTII